MKTSHRFLRILALTISLCILGTWVGAVGARSAADAPRPVRVTTADDGIAPAYAPEPAAPGAAADAPRTSSVEERADWTLGREAHADGGYWYWLERQPAERALGANPTGTRSLVDGR